MMNEIIAACFQCAIEHNSKI